LLLAFRGPNAGFLVVMGEPDSTAFVPWDDRSYDNDDDDDAGPFCWRMPLEENHSDWTIEITTELTTNGEGQMHTYHVHKVYLSMGPKKSKYFFRLFRSAGLSELDIQKSMIFTEFETKTSKIELNTIAADAFPSMLDYMYSRDTDDDDDHPFTTENATAMRFLGQYFEISLLRSEATQFCKNDMCIENLATYYEHAQLFRDEKILKMVAMKCCDELKEIDLDFPLMQLSDVSLWKNIIHLFLNGHAGPSYDSKPLSRLIGEFCSVHRDLVDAEIFALLTDSTHMKEIDKDAAVPLLKLEHSILPESKAGDVFTSLQSRCIRAIAKSWKSIDGKTLRRDLAGLKPGLFDLAFDMVVEEAKKLENRVVNKVVVEGAGTVEVNGTYYMRDINSTGASCFHMDGTYQGNPAKFELNLSVQRGASSETLFWWISTKNESGLYTSFYRAPRADEHLSTPSSNGWVLASTGTHPIPTLNLLSDDDSGN